MGQYYRAIILAERAEGEKEYIRGWFDSFAYGNGCKLMEHSYVGNKFVTAVEEVLRNGGTFYKTRVVWAGDYADDEPNQEEAQNLYILAIEDTCFNAPSPYNQDGIRFVRQANTDMTAYPYIVNHTTKEYVNKTGRRIHPLPILTSEGNGRGGGDFGGNHSEMAGLWARHVISLEKEIPDSYRELKCEFDAHSDDEGEAEDE
jgi:hypothetical protein